MDEVEIQVVQLEVLEGFLARRKNVFSSMVCAPAKQVQCVEECRTQTMAPCSAREVCAGDEMAYFGNRDYSCYFVNVSTLPTINITPS